MLLRTRITLKPDLCTSNPPQPLKIRSSDLVTASYRRHGDECAPVWLLWWSPYRVHPSVSATSPHLLTVRRYQRFLLLLFFMFDATFFSLLPLLIKASRSFHGPVDLRP